jgi:glycosyltransferase involved in cell wall biosynthesis
METDVTVSVIIPVYRGAAFVIRAIESVCAQLSSPDAPVPESLEVLVIDDGSPDEAAEVVMAWVARSPSCHVRLIRQTNQGMAAARNAGLRAATGELVAFLDQDDTWPPDSLGWRIAALRANPDAVLIAAKAAWVTQDGTVLGYYGTNDCEVTAERLFHANPFASPGVALMRTAAVRRCGGFDEHIWGADDWDLWLRLQYQGRMLADPRVALLQLQHSHQASRDVTRMARNVRAVLRKNLARVPASYSGGSRAQLRRVAADGYARTYGWIHRREILNLLRQRRLVAAALELPSLGWGWRVHAAVGWRASSRRLHNAVVGRHSD